MSDHPEYQTDLGGFCSPIIVYDPSQPTGEMQDKIAQQTDILPTVLGMIGYQKPHLGFGIDLFNNHIVLITVAENSKKVLAYFGSGV